MKADFVKMALVLMSLVLAGAMEELLPKFAGVGFPFLLGLSFASVSWGLPYWVFVALTAGATEDALSGLPFATSMVFFLAMAALVRYPRSRLACLAGAYPVYQFWLGLWGSGIPAGAVTRFLVAVPLGILTFLPLCGLFRFVARKAGLDED